VVVASFHLASFPRRSVLSRLAATPWRRRALRATPGLRFLRELGTGRGTAMGLGADLRRWATFAVWEDGDALDGFPRAWAAGSTEAFAVRLAPLGGHGTWGGTDPLAGARADAVTTGPLAVLTRATIAPRHWWAFARAVAPVEEGLHATPGLLAAVGVGEAPVGRLATFSLWRTAAEAEAFAYGHGGPHAAVTRRARDEGWFREELFARFRPYASTGTWSGRDPLASAAGRLGGKGS
jgi:hypothetical protein